MAEETSDKNSNPSMAQPEKTHDQEGNCKMVNGEESNVGKEARFSIENKPGSGSKNKQNSVLEKNKKKTNLKKINEDANEVKDDLGEMKGMVVAELSEREPPRGKGDGRGMELKHEGQGERKGKRQDEGKSERKGKRQDEGQNERKGKKQDEGKSEKKSKRQRERQTDQHVATQDAATQNATTQGVPNGTNSEHHQANLSNETPPSCSSASNVDQTISRTYIRREPTKLDISSNEQTSREEQNDEQDEMCCHDDERKENSILTNKKILICPGRENNDVVESNHNEHYIERYTNCSVSNIDKKKTGNVNSGENNPAYVKRPYFEPNYFNQRIMKNSNIPSFGKYCPYEKNCLDHNDGRNTYHSSAGTNSVVNVVNSSEKNSSEKNSSEKNSSEKNSSENNNSENNSSENNKSENNNSGCNIYGCVNVVPPPNGLSSHQSNHQEKQQVEYQEQQLDANSKKAQTDISFISTSGRSQNDLRMNSANVQHHHVVPPYVHPLGNKEQGIRIGTYTKDRYYNKGKEKIHDQYYRIKLCPFLKKGLCQKGDNCSYAHSTDTLRSCMNLMKTKICQLWLKNECRNPNCVYAHGEGELRATPDYFKTKLCKYFDKEGTCPSGEKCRHAHGQAELRQRNYKKTELEKFSPKSRVSPKFTFHDLKNKGECPQYILNMLSGRSRKENVDRSDWNSWNEANIHNAFSSGLSNAFSNGFGNAFSNAFSSGFGNGLSNAFSNGLSNGSRYHRDTRVATPTDENSNAQTTSLDKRAALPDQICRPEKRESTNEITQVYQVSAADSCTNQEKEIHAVLTLCERKENSDGEKNNNGSNANMCGAKYSDKRETPREEQIFKTEMREEADKEIASHEDTRNLHHAVSGTTSSISVERDGNGEKELRDDVVEGGTGNGTGNGTRNGTGNGAREASEPEQRAENQKERKSRSPGDETLSEKNQNLAHRRKSVEMKNEEIELSQNEEQHSVGKASHSGDMNDDDYKMLREAVRGGEKMERTLAEVLDHSSEYMSSGQSSSQYMSIGRSSSEGEGESYGNRSPNKSYGWCNQDFQGERRGQAKDENNGQMGDGIQGSALLEMEIEREDDNRYEIVEIGNASVEEDPQASRSETGRSFEGDKNENGNVDRGENGNMDRGENGNMDRGENGNMNRGENGNMDRGENGNMDHGENGDDNANGRGGNEKQRDRHQEQEPPTLNEYRCTRPTNEMDNCSKKVISGENIIERRYANNCPRGGERYGSFRNFNESGNDILRNPIFMLKNQYRTENDRTENDRTENDGTENDRHENERNENDGKKNLLLSKLASYHTASTSSNYGPKNFNYKHKKFNMASRYAKNFEGLDHFGSVSNYGVGGNVAICGNGGNVAICGNGGNVAICGSGGNVASYGNCDRDDLNNGGELINNEGTQNCRVIGGNGRGSGNAPEARAKKGDAQGEHNKHGDHNEPEEQLTNGRVKIRGEDQNCSDIPLRNFTCKSSHRSFNSTYSTPEQNPSNQNFENEARYSHTNHNHANNSLHMQNVLPRPNETYSNVCNSGAHRTKQNCDKSNGTTSNDMLHGPPVYPLNTLVNNFSYYNYNVSNVYSNRNNCYSFLNVELNSVNMTSQTRVLPAELSISAQGGGTTEEAYRAANEEACRATTGQPCRAENRQAYRTTNGTANQAANTTDVLNALNNRAHHSPSEEAANGQSVFGTVAPITLRSTNRTNNRSSKSHPCSNQHRKKIWNIQNVGSNATNMHFSGNKSANAQGNNNRQERNCTSSNVAVGSSHYRSSVTQANTNDNFVHNGNSGSSSASNMVHNDRSDPPVGSLSGNNNSGHGLSDENDLSGDNSGSGPVGGSSQNGGRGQMDRSSQNGGSGSYGENPNLRETQVSQNGGREKRKRNPHFPYSSHRNYERRINNAHFKNYRNYNNHVYTNQMCANQVYSNQVYANRPAYGSNQAYYGNQVYTYQHPYSNYMYSNGGNAYSNNGHTHSNNGYTYSNNGHTYSNNGHTSSSHPYNNNGHPYNSSSSSAYVIYPYSGYPYSISYHHSSNYPYDGLYTFDGEYPYGGAYPYDGAYPHDAVQPYNGVNPYNGNPHCESVQPYGSAPHYSSNHYYGDVEQFSSGQLYGAGQLYSGGQVYIDAQQYGDADQCGDVQPYGGDHHYNGNQSGVHNGSYTNDQSYVHNQYPYNDSMNYGPPYHSNDTEEGQNGNSAPPRDSLLDSEEYQNRPNEDENNANDTCQDESAFDDSTKNTSTEEGEEGEDVEGDEAAQQSPLQPSAEFQQ
ncbi:hypothetical protein PCYB_094050 [Plasmodium cynomolgi strain B]|uniref:C3H1-type domain-containing protein n=1 Tax=Plasmodium cynomolgi (strain B) TaxID=1120755 RepID=K6UW92_PLACD|nr:hypothetical protein PCYB_094050 [Plasmodium cynomolgi strain B]GAB66620.1 hypothetical protein PCYB_094050 [Plasmodium cynomolgi strain B]